MTMNDEKFTVTDMDFEKNKSKYQNHVKRNYIYLLAAASHSKSAAFSLIY